MQGDSATRDAHVDGVQASQVRVRTVGMEEQGVPLRRGRGPAGGLEAERARGEQLAPPRVGAGDAVRRGVLDVVLWVREAVAAVEEHVGPVRGPDDLRRLDQRAVLVDPVQDLHGAADLCRPVVDVHLLQHDGRRVQGCNPVVAISTIPDAVPISVQLSAACCS